MTHNPTNTGCCAETRPAGAADVLSGLAHDAAGGLGKLFSILYAWQQRAATRYRLMELDDRMLKDIGLSRSDAYREGEKPFWRP